MKRKYPATRKSWFRSLLDLRRHRWVPLSALALVVGIAWLIWMSGAEERAERRRAEREAKSIQIQNETREQLALQLGPYFHHNKYPETANIVLNGVRDDYSIEYSLDPGLQQAAERLLRNYKPDYGAVVVMNALSGQVLALVSYDRGRPGTNNLNLKSTFPAASIFKIVTASAAVDRHKLSPDTIVMFNGGDHTLYRRNVMNDRVTRWTREMSLREAFARSINTFFGRLAFEHLTPQDLNDYAIRFGFNQRIVSDLPFELSFTEIPQEKSFELAEIASGFNKVTNISPIHGAMIAASVAATGVMRAPYIIDRVRDSSGKEVFASTPITAAVTMSPQGAYRLKELMEATVHRGTSRSAFRPLLRNRKFNELEVGGKTGSLTGGSPRGKLDWFVGYAIGDEGQRLAVAALTVNVKYWTVKSSFLAQSLFQTHFKAQFSKANEDFFRAPTNETTAAARDE